MAKDDFFSRNVMYYGMGTPNRKEDEYPEIKPFEKLPKIDIKTPMPEVKLPKIESSKEDNTILNNYKNSIALNLLQHLNDLEYLTELNDKIEWCFKRANRIIELIFGEKEKQDLQHKE